MGKVIEVHLGEFRSVTKLDLNNVECQRDDMVIVEIDKGYECGRIVSDVKSLCEGKVENLEGKVVRKATEGDLRQIENNRIKSNESQIACLRKINDRQLDMNIVKTEYTFDCSKVIFFFTSEGRVDFRNLVKDLAKIFRVRIELKQIGVRDRAKIIGGYGVCGRELCCSSYMKGFHALAIKMAKTQNLPLNPSRISGVCGRIKCCMAYEYQVYKEYARAMPKVGDKFDTEQGKGKIVDINILKHYVHVDLGEGKIIKVEVGQPA